MAKEIKIIKEKTKLGLGTTCPNRRLIVSGTEKK